MSLAKKYQFSDVKVKLTDKHLMRDRKINFCEIHL